MFYSVNATLGRRSEKRSLAGLQNSLPTKGDPKQGVWEQKEGFRIAVIRSGISSIIRPSQCAI